MKRKVAWLVVSCLMVAALLLASCAPAVVEEKKVTPPVEKGEVAPPVKEKEVVVPGKEVVPEGFVKWTGVKQDGTVVEKMIEKPRYGGVHIQGRLDPPTVFDEVLRSITSGWATSPVNEELTLRDWTRGPAGTEEWSPQLGFCAMPGNTWWLLATSWELPEPDTLVLRIRQGVHWQDKPPMNGRELTVDDVLVNLRRHWKLGYAKNTYAYLRDMQNVDESVYLSPTDKRAIVLKSAPEMVSVVYETSVSHVKIFPPEVMEKYGNVNDWKNSVGTGPYMLTDYVSGSALTYVRNPNYWNYDPLFPENQLPYPDGMKVLIIPDLSTLMAALRTGKVDNLWGIPAESAEPLLKTNPELEWMPYVASSIPMIWMRGDTKPFDDIRVRRALNMAVNQKEICDVYYKGKAFLFAYPVTPIIGEYMDMYAPLEQMPESVREMYEYHPDKARQLLAEAGYPAGFQTNVITEAKNVDLLSVVKEYLAKIGVDLSIDVKDVAVFNAITSKRTHTQMIMAGQHITSAWKLNNERVGTGNSAMIEDPVKDEIYAKIMGVFFDRPKFHQAIKDSVAYRNEVAWGVYLPQPFIYTFWQPWLKNYYGIQSQGYSLTINYTYMIWIDQALKKAMGR